MESLVSAKCCAGGSSRTCLKTPRESPWILQSHRGFGRPLLPLPACLDRTCMLRHTAKACQWHVLAINACADPLLCAGSDSRISSRRYICNLWQTLLFVLVACLLPGLLGQAKSSLHLSSGVLAESWSGMSSVGFGSWRHRIAGGFAFVASLAAS